MSNTASVSRQPAALVMGMLMLLVALPYAVSSIILLQPVATLPAALAQHEWAQNAFPTGETAASLAALKLAAAQKGLATWPEAETALASALDARPQDPLGWARLAYVYGRENKTGLIGPALARSIETGPYVPGFMQWRFILSLSYWDNLDDETRELVAKQAGRIWRSKPNDFIRLARMPLLALQIQHIMEKYLPDESAPFLQRRGRLRHTR